MIPDRALELLRLYVKADRLSKAKRVSAHLASRMDMITNAQLKQFIVIAGTLDQADAISTAIGSVKNRSLIDLELAKVLLRIAHVAENEPLADRVESALCDRIAPAELSLFRIEATRMRQGPQAALSLALATRSAARDPRMATSLARLLIDTGRKELALRYLLLCVRRWPNSLPVLKSLAHAFIQAGLPEKGLEWFEAHQSEKIVGPLADVYVRFLLVLGRLEEIVEHIKTEIAAGRKSAGNIMLLQLLCTLGRPEEAESVATLMKANPQHAKRNRVHFSISLLGTQLNELRLYRQIVPKTGQVPTDPDLAATYLQAATEVLDARAACAPCPVSADMAPPIPRRIFQYWNTPTVPEAIDGIMQTWREVPGWTYEQFDRSQALRWLSETFDADHRRAFTLARHVAEESDFLRLCVLYQQGGIYVDADDMLTGHPNDIIGAGPGLIVFREPFGALANNLICAPPGHPAIGQAMAMAKTALLGLDNDNTWSKTGPGLLTRAVAWHMLQNPEHARRDTQVLPHYHLFRHTLPHVPLPYKTTASYWNAGAFRTTDSVMSALTTLAETGQGQNPGHGS
ncbi:hypothetical protein RA29_18970 [Tateyamaria sp. ANG-S1]|nr:hypothetical protein RA29_18970 [Tateyamaria sp. ANG-S1]